MVKTNQKGFTLLELAIVLVIIGIILGAILKGQELINNAKAKRLLNDTKGLATLQYTFYDRYGRFAGDCDNNGAIDMYASDAIVPQSFGATSYGFCYNPNSPTADATPDPQWKELGQAQLVSFSNAREVARNPYSGALYAASTHDKNYTYYNVIVATQVPCYAAKVVDQAIDGSLDANNGNVRILKGTNFGGDGTGTGDATKPAEWDCDSEQQLVAYVYFFDRRPN
ncbi:prepilin-type N-terminal cleavage/methylation domain-containing protein [Sulfurihydrogenibium sp.]|uniref:prepilin-type N-terminal cleavage/methylation domain-containing protein n=1 Tax=Sulfurihydrogenibium sp. TaxID=2053621 RepID=UPI002623E5FA|nr:prepilin-type N-terminal cleavage/methylation domain-containing protein [Sulfurihydrogenibium sp.]